MAWFEHGTSKIYYEDNGSGVPLLLLPGITDRIANHAALRDLLAQRYRVIAADLPGSGQSGPQPRNYGPGYHEEDARSFAALLRSLGTESAHLVGYSDGGEVALLMAALWPGNARSVLAWGAAGALNDTKGEVRAAFRRVFDDPLPSMRDYRTYLLNSYGEDTARKSVQSFVGAWDAIVAAGGDISCGKADRIACPVCLMVGQNDFSVTKNDIDVLASRIKRAETFEVEAAGHGVHEDQPEWFLKTVSGWLDQH